MRPTQMLLVVGAVLVANGVAAKPARKYAIEVKADELLRKASAGLASMKTFTVETRQVMEVVTKEGERLQSVASSTVNVERPNKLRTDRMGPLGGANVYYDGKTLTVYGKRDKLYATSPAPDTLDATIDFAREKLAIDAPAADLLTSDVYATLTDDVVSGKYMGSEPVGDRMCHHLAFRGRETDWQLWVDDSARALPCRFVIISKKETGAPEYAVDLFDWKVDPSFPADTFAFTAPRDANKIGFLVVADDVRKGKQQARR